MDAGAVPAYSSLRRIAVTNRRARVGSLAFALFAAYLLVFQSLFGATASGRHMAEMAVDRAIHLATCDPTSSGSFPTSDHQSKLPPCCTQGCALVGATGDVPANVAAIIAYETVLLAERAPFGPPRKVSPTHESSGQPQAPPRHLRKT